ncbi:hypothetical protein CSW64_05635 [Caulobacter mirabilis]|uniref:DUF898 domain-containing protein n=2 Tax=Caulobacter mirabilis TaxID=69666 RepID=A0A2D2AV93_9CAUL|nr:hypothetical protein CSW64_05635 [Caulobacter mirabilis]
MDDMTAAARGETLTFSERIELKPFLWLSLKNGLLNIITLTLYRFWGKTEVRRRVWSKIAVNDEPFEYTGRGVELFLGFLIALFTVGLPFLIVVFGAQFLGPAFALLIILPLYIGMFVLLGAAIFLAFRYMASRTRWRGIRFRMHGSPLNFAFSYMGWLLLTGVTLGWYTPVMSLNVAERLWGGLRFGDQHFRFVKPDDHGLWGPFALAWVGSIVGYIVVVIPGMIAVMAATGSLTAETPTEPSVAGIVGLYGVLFVYLAIAMLVYAPYHAAVMRTVAGSLRLGDARFKLDVTAMPLLGLTITNTLLLVFSIGLLSPYVQARTVRFMVKRLTSTGEAPLAEALQTGAGPRTGEGLADAFDFSII